MAVLVYIDHIGGEVKKASLEALTYAKLMNQGDIVGVALGSIDASKLAALGAYGASKVLHVNDAAFDSFDARPFTKAVAEAVAASGASVVITSHNSTGKSLAPRIAANLKAGLVAGAIALPNMDGGTFTVRKSVFSGKAFADCTINSDKKVVSVSPNAFQVQQGEGSATVETLSVSVGAGDFRIKIQEVSRRTDTVALPEAELVVSAGRGLKGPENWGMIEEWATVLGAATACSRPVADVGWRPHHEHVGQTGVTVSPNLYIAVGISGAIQHLAGVSSSKVIVVINTDPEAPFFKAADYGIVGDAFDVVPRLLAATKKFKAEQGA
ncbi:MAG: electron transfer flavoprotein subunit alpha/FixB family protein [Chitinophagales bacterium]